jgi:proteasome accessory factor C
MSVYEDLLNLIPWLRTHPGSTIPEVAKHFGWTDEQVVQYVLMAGVSGPGELHGELIDVHLDGDRINLVDGLGLDRPFQFDQVEAALILLGLELLTQNPQFHPDVDRGSVQSAAEKIRDVLPRVPKVQAIPISESSDGLLIIQKALQSNRRISFTYWNEASDLSEAREVSPSELVYTGGLTRLNAWCHTRNAWRTFIVKRMNDVSLLDEAIYEPDSSFSGMDFTTVEISVPTHLLYQLEGMNVVSRGALKAEGVKAKISVLEPSWLARQILSSGCQIRVLGPIRFGNKVNDLVAAAQNSYLDLK